MQRRHKKANDRQKAVVEAEAEAEAEAEIKVDITLYEINYSFVQPFDPSRHFSQAWHQFVLSLVLRQMTGISECSVRIIHTCIVDTYLHVHVSLLHCTRQHHIGTVLDYQHHIGGVVCGFACALQTERMPPVSHVGQLIGVREMKCQYNALLYNVIMYRVVQY